MISLYSGTPGSYKSYHATADAVQWLGRGKNVIANFPIDASKYYKNKRKKLGQFYFVPNSELTVDYLMRFHRNNHKPNVLKAQTLLIFDEASIPFNARQFDRQDRMDWINFFANHRHFNYEIILIAQNDRMLDRQVRGLLEYEIKHRALKNWNLAFALVSLMCKGLFHCVEYWYPCKLKTDTQLKKFNQKIANCYDTMALFKFQDKDKLSHHADQSDTSSQTDTKQAKTVATTNVDREKIKQRLASLRGENSA